MELLVAHGGTLSWGTYTLSVTSFQYSSQVNSDIDITSMASPYVSDPGYTSRKLVAQEFDTCFMGQGGGELSCDFYVDGGQTSLFNAVGHAKFLDFRTPGFAGGNLLHFWGHLTQVQFTAATGDFCKGSATFKLSNRES